MPERAAQGPPGAKVAAHGLWSLAASLLLSLMVTGASIVVARVLGPSEFGRYVFAVFVYGAGSQVAVWGLRGAVTRFVAVARGHGNADEEAAVVASGVKAGVVGSVIVAAATAIGASLLDPGARLPTVLAGLVVLSLGPTQVLTSVMAGREQFRRLALWQMSVGALNPLATVIIVLAGGGVVAILVVDVVATAIGLASLWYVARPLPVRRPARLAPGFWSFAVRDAVLVVLGIVVFQRSEVLFLEAVSSSAQVAMYGVAFGLSQVVWRVAGPLLSALLPALSRVLDTDDPRSVRDVVGRTVQASVLLGFAAAAVGAVLAPAAVAVLYGPRFEAAELPARILFAFSWAMVVGTALSSVAQARAEMDLLVRITAIGAVLNLALDALLIGRWGALGAAFANSVAQAMVTTALWWRVDPAIGAAAARAVPSAFVPALAAALTAALAVVLLPPLPALLVGSLLAGVVFLGLGRWTGAIDDTLVAVARHLIVLASQSIFRRAKAT